MLSYAAAFIHECAHGYAAYILGIKPSKITVGICGMRLTTPAINSSKAKILIYSAGPGASFVLWGYLFAAQKLFLFGSDFLVFFAFANFVMGIANLLPVFPLDGGVILKSVLTMHFGIIKAAKKCRLISSVLLTFTVALVAGLFYCKIFNPGVAGIFLFLLLNRNKEHYHSIAEKKNVLSGEIISKTKLKYMACDGESELLCLAEYISYDYTLIVAVFCNGKFIGDLNQADIIAGINKYGALCTVKEYITKTPRA